LFNAVKSLKPIYMMKNVTESLSGRAGIVRMLGLSNSEIDGTGFGPFEIEPQMLIKRLETAKQLPLPEMYERIFRSRDIRAHGQAMAVRFGFKRIGRAYPAVRQQRFETDNKSPAHVFHGHGALRLSRQNEFAGVFKKKRGAKGRGKKLLSTQADSGRA
jgi:hypothetical protein